MTEIARCTWCGNMFLTEQVRDWHEPKCDDNPNKKSTVEGKVPDGPVPRCPHCQAEFTNTTARDNHVPRCPDNPDREPDDPITVAKNR